MSSSNLTLKMLHSFLYEFESNSITFFESSLTQNFIKLKKKIHLNSPFSVVNLTTGGFIAYSFRNKD